MPLARGVPERHAKGRERGGDGLRAGRVLRDASILSERSPKGEASHVILSERSPEGGASHVILSERSPKGEASRRISQRVAAQHEILRLRSPCGLAVLRMT